MSWIGNGASVLCLIFTFSALRHLAAFNIPPFLSAAFFAVLCAYAVYLDMNEQEAKQKKYREVEGKFKANPEAFLGREESVLELTKCLRESSDTVDQFLKTLSYEVSKLDNPSRVQPGIEDVLTACYQSKRMGFEESHQAIEEWIERYMRRR